MIRNFFRDETGLEVLSTQLPQRWLRSQLSLPSAHWVQPSTVRSPILAPPSALARQWLRKSELNNGAGAL